MTKRAIKWWNSFNFWDKVRLLLISLGIGSEITLYIVEAFPQWKIIAAGATALSLIITYFFKDKDGDNIVDIFE